MATDLSAAVERLLQGAERQERTVATTQ
jgi:hypothetical protein